MFHGKAVERFAFIITIGNRPPEAYVRHSAIYKSPCDDVAVKALAPTAEAPIAQERAECSDSTWINSAFKLLSSTISESRSTTIVCGVMGYAEITCGFASRMPSAKASLPDKNFLAIIFPPPFLLRLFYIFCDRFRSLCKNHSQYRLFRFP